jgi:hypothetical protein
MEVTSSKVLRFPTGKLFDLTDMYYDFNASAAEVVKFSADFEKIIGWYERRGADRQKLIAYYKANGNGAQNINEQIWSALAERHRNDAAELNSFVETVNKQ